MMRLTMRSGKDGRFLARVIDPGGFPFVLDFGDRRIIDDTQQRLLHGFTMWRFGRLVTVGPQDPDMIQSLAEFYAGEGLLVSLEEPNWASRSSPELNVPISSLEREIPDIEEHDFTTELGADVTDVVNLEEITDLGAFLSDATPVPCAERDEVEDAPTEVVGKDDDDDDTEIGIRRR